MDILLSLLEALEFSADKHRNQRRKDIEASPYINHPIKVTHILAKEGGVEDQTTLIAAILHDTIEDTETTAPELESIFGRNVRELVDEVTDDKSLPKKERKRLQIEHAKHSSTQAKMIKIADKICNIKDIMESPPKDWSKERKIQYLDWSEKVVQACRGCNTSLEKLFKDTLQLAKNSLERKN